MKVHVSLEIENTDDLAALGRFFSSTNEAPDTTINAGAPDEQAAIEAPKPSRRGRPRKADAKSELQPQPEPEDEQPAETVDKALVAKELRAFIADKGSTDGPRLAMQALREFGANKFDELAAENYSKFLTAINKLR